MRFTPLPNQSLNLSARMPTAPRPRAPGTLAHKTTAVDSRSAALSIARMNADIGFTPGTLIEAARSIRPIAAPPSQSISPLGKELEPPCQGANGPYVEALSHAMTSWSNSLSVLYEDPGRLSDALVGVEQSFGVCETAIIQSLIEAASGSSGDDSTSPSGSLGAVLQALSEQDAGGGAQ